MIFLICLELLNLLDGHQANAREKRHRQEKLPELDMLDQGNASDIWVVGLNSHFFKEVIIQSVK